MAVDFTIKQNDQLPELIVTLTDANGDVVDVGEIVGVTFIMADKATGTNLVDAAATVVNGEAGIVKYVWQGSDTSIASTYNAEFHVEFLDGRVETFPNSTYILIKIFADLTE